MLQDPIVPGITQSFVCLFFALFGTPSFSTLTGMKHCLRPAYLARLEKSSIIRLASSELLVKTVFS